MKKLKTALLVNSLSSGATGIGLILAPRLIAEMFNANKVWPFIAIGIFLVLFSLFVFYAYLNSDLKSSVVKGIIYMDIFWVVGSLIIIVPALFNLSNLGYIMITAVAVWVGAMAYFQNQGLRESSGFQKL